MNICLADWTRPASRFALAGELKLCTEHCSSRWPSRSRRKPTRFVLHNIAINSAFTKTDPACIKTDQAYIRIRRACIRTLIAMYTYHKITDTITIRVKRPLEEAQRQARFSHIRSPVSSDSPRDCLRRRFETRGACSASQHA